MQLHAAHPLGPDSILPASAWFGWADQAAYFLAAHGWATGDLSPALHLYPAGYALLAAPFVRFMPGEPFYLPNLLCWVASLWLFAALATQLGRGVFGTRAAGGLLFFLATVASSRAFYSWEVPWTSTPAATLAFAAWLAALRFLHGASLRAAAAAAVLAGGIVLFRPTDATVLMSGIGLTLTLAALRRPRPMPALAVIGLAFCVGPGLLLWTHWLTHGWTLGKYFEVSRLTGFEWRLLPLRWVTLVLDPRPLFPGGRSLEELFPYVAPGIAGVLACVLTPGHRLRHALAGGTAIAFFCLYLCYRDLHVAGLVDFMNYHYFKWTLPVFALYAANLLHLLLAERRWRAGLAAVAGLALLCCWRAELASDAKAAPARVTAGGHGLEVPGGLPQVDQAVLVPSADNFLAIYFGQHVMASGGRVLAASVDFKLYPVPHGFMLAPLRPLPGPLSLQLAAPLQLDPQAVPQPVRQRIVFGLPCSVLPKRAICQYRALPRPSL